MKEREKQKKRKERREERIREERNRNEGKMWRNWFKMIQTYEARKK